MTDADQSSDVDQADQGETEPGIDLGNIDDFQDPIEAQQEGTGVTERRRSNTAVIRQLRDQLAELQLQLQQAGINVPLTVETPDDFIVEAPQDRSYNDLVSQARRKSLSKPAKSTRFADELPNPDEGNLPTLSEVQIDASSNPVIDGRALGCSCSS